MNDIGIKLKAAREKIGISLEEAAEDMKVSLEQINEIETGEMDNFQDIYFLKYFIRDYAKYLGLDKEELVDEFNEYLFDYTSKLSLEEIKKEVKQVKDELNRIKSPYTIERETNNFLQYFICLVIILLILIVGFLIYFIATDDKDGGNIIGLRGIYELSM